MSIVTRNGDKGMTSLLYGKLVSKADPHVRAYGTVDEVNAALGLCRASAQDDWAKGMILSTQSELIGLMGELACDAGDVEKYLASKLPRLTDEHLERVEKGIEKIEAMKLEFKGWATPGASIHAASLDVARTVCRRAEREVVCLQNSVRPLIVKYLNRLSDFLWLLARYEEHLLSTKK
jgi:cob(I)alamin adenosyltransferase